MILTNKLILNFFSFYNIDMVYCIIIFILFIFALLLTIDKKLKLKATKIYYYFSDQCRHCVKMTPIYNAAKNYIKSTASFNSYIFIEIPITSDKPRLHDVEGVPTIIKVKDGVEQKYDGHVCPRKLVEWML